MNGGTAAAATAILGMGAQTMLGQVDGGAVSLAGLERLGIAAVTVAMMWYFLQREYKKNERLEGEVRELHEKVRVDLVKVLDSHSEAMRENAASNRAVATAIGAIRV